MREKIVTKIVKIVVQISFLLAESIRIFLPSLLTYLLTLSISWIKEKNM